MSFIPRDLQQRIASATPEQYRQLQQTSSTSTMPPAADPSVSDLAQQVHNLSLSNTLENQRKAARSTPYESTRKASIIYPNPPL